MKLETILLGQEQTPLDYVRKHRITRREIDVIQEIANGLSNREAARKLFVEEQTIKFHLSNLYPKIRASGRAHAVAILLRERVIR